MIIGLLLGGCLDEDEKALNLGTNTWPGYEPLYLARDLGYFDKNSVKLVEYVSTSEVLRSFRNRNIDAAALTLDEALLLSESGADFKIILVTDVSNGGDAIVGQSNVKSLRDLYGKVVGVEGTALGAYVLTRALEINRMSLGDVQVRNLEPHEHEKAFLQRKVDAIVTFDPTRSNLLRNGARELFSSREIPGEIVDVIVVRPDAFEKHQHHILSLVRGWFHALQYLKVKPDDATRRIDFRLKMGAEQVLASYSRMQLPDRAENERFLLGDTPALIPTVTELQEMMIAKKLLKSRVPIRSIFAKRIPGISGN